MLNFFKKMFVAADVAPPVAPSAVILPFKPRLGPNVVIINESTVLRDADVAAVVPALQTQLDRDFSPVWETSATLSFASKGASVPPGCWVIAVLDDSDQAGALGYHDLTADGLPVAKVFAKSDLQYGLSWSVTISHELLEMLVDPYICNCAFAQETNTTGVLFAYEVADAVEDDKYGYKIYDILVSDFVYPAWFEAGRTGVKFDYLGLVKAPFQLLDGGYISTFQVGPNSAGWQQITPGAPSARLLSKGPSSRKNRRAHPSK